MRAQPPHLALARPDERRHVMRLAVAGRDREPREFIHHNPV
jgi:hypothetical protein